MIGWIAAWEACWWLAQRGDRARGYRRALAAARRRKKPLLIVGICDGEYGHGQPDRGDVVVDLRPEIVARRQGIPNYVRANVEDLARFGDRHFGACFCSFTLSHCCDARRALAELRRVADETVIVEARWWRLSSYLVPGRAWVVAGDRAVRLPWARRCNAPTRYGTARPTAFGAVILPSSEIAGTLRL